jgi:ABC-type glycerol-3-phosphate transport system permease component
MRSPTASPVRRIAGRVPELLVAGSVLLVILCPLVWLVLLSVKTVEETYELPLRWLPQAPTLSAYETVWVSRGFSNDWVQYFSNTLIAATVVSAVVAFVGVAMGYALSRLRSRWVSPLLLVLVLVQLLNGPALIVPIYSMTRALGLYDTLVGYILVLTVFFVPFGALLGHNFARAVPMELDEAGRVDGCRQWQVFLHIYLPLAKVGLVTTGVMTFLLVWGEYPFAVSLLESTSSVTVSRALASLVSGLNVLWNQMAAAAVVISIPMVIILLVAQRHVVRGLTSGVGK